MTIDECFQYLDLLSNKSQSGGFTPAQFNISAERCQLEFYNKQYREFQKTREVTDSISPWIVPSIINPDVNGQVPYPPDYKHVSAIRHIRFVNSIAQVVSVEEITNNDIGNMLMSQVAPATSKYPKVSYYNNYLQFYPKNIGAIQFDYLIGPTAPKWAYTLVNNRAVYDPKNSIDFQALDGSQTEIMYNMLSELGINLSKTDQISYAEAIKQQRP